MEDRVLYVGDCSLTWQDDMRDYMTHFMHRACRYRLSVNFRSEKQTQIGWISSTRKSAFLLLRGYSRLVKVSAPVPAVISALESSSHKAAAALIPADDSSPAKYSLLCTSKTDLKEQSHAAVSLLFQTTCCDVTTCKYHCAADEYIYVHFPLESKTWTLSVLQ